MSTGKMDSSTVYALFEELKQLIGQLGKNEASNNQKANFDFEEAVALMYEIRSCVKQFSPEQIKELQNNIAKVSAYSLGKVNDNLTKVLTELKVLITPIDEKVSLLKIPQNTVIRKEHVFTVDFRNSKAAITIITMALVILLSWGGNIYQLRNNYQLKDNDLKYRYVKTEGKASSRDLIRLEDIFTYNRNRDSISVIRERVKAYERFVKEQAEKIERTSLHKGNSKVK